MPKLINYGSEMLKISSDGKSIEYSTNNGAGWNRRCILSASNGTPQVLSDGGNELLLTTDKKLLYSKNKGAGWNVRKTF